MALAIPPVKRRYENFRNEIEQLRCQNETLNNQVEQLRSQIDGFGHKVILIKNFNEYDKFIDKCRKCDTGGLSQADFRQQYKIDFTSFVELFGTPPPPIDPFSDEYANYEMSFFEFLFGKGYNLEDEGQKFDVEEACKKPLSLCSLGVGASTLNAGISRMREFASFLEKVRPESGMRVLEMGCGKGDLTELLGRCGCIITGIDISEFSTEYTRNRMAMQNITAKIICEPFNYVNNIEDTFDLVVFQASFHHCWHPVKILNMLNKKLPSGGRIVFFDEPIHPHFDRPWGMVRYDGDSLFAIRALNWLELGFREDFFIQMLYKTGFRLNKAEPMVHSSLYEAVKI